ncbi:MAG: ABC transporter ATP-binding protein [Acidobacteriota bacterium]|nr:ABC transporter ATP-binding protein [Acidobacteriota bacterium]
MSFVVLDQISKCYRVYGRPSDHLKEMLSFGRRTYHTPFWAVRDASFEIERGCCLGIIGENGSGKSTLLSIIAGVVRPTHGILEVNGRISALLELGSGFNPEFTGRENIFLNASILGFSDSQTRERIPSIEKFAEIGEFVDRPLKTYSTGMFVRLAFAVAIHMDPEILIVDESLSVGDIFFQQRCIRRIHRLKSEGVTIVFVSHDLATVHSLAERTLWMDHGKVRMNGPTDDVVSRYLEVMVGKGHKQVMGTEAMGAPLETSSDLDVSQDEFGKIPDFLSEIPNVDHQYGNGKAKICGIGIFEKKGQLLASVVQGERICVRISIEFLESVATPNVGFMLRNRLGEDVTGTNTLFEGLALDAVEAGDRISVDFIVELPFLRAGFYYFSPAVADGSLDEYEMCEWLENAFALEIIESSTTYGQMRVPTHVRTVTVDRGETQ